MTTGHSPVPSRGGAPSPLQPDGGAGGLTRSALTMRVGGRPPEVWTLVFLALSGGVLCLAGALFPPESDTPRLLDAAGAGLAALFAAWLWWGGLGPRAWRAHVVASTIVLATCALLATAATGEGAVSGCFAFVVLGLYLAAFFPRSTARAYAAAIAVLSGVAVAASDAIEHPVMTWLPIAVTVVASTEILAAVVGGLRALATTDPLTGALNRAGFAQAVERARAAAARSGEQLTLVVIDLNGFKGVNDDRGHAAGDALLVRLHDEWRASLRACDLIGRRGGDEFTLLLIATDEIDAEAVVKRLQAGASHAWSYGVAELERGVDLEECLRRADERMYAQKVGLHSRSHHPAF